MKNIAAFAYSTRARTLKRLQTWALCGAVALAGLLGAGQAWADPPFDNNGDGTVTDTSSGLMWDECAAGLSGSACGTGTAVGYTWANALGLVATQNTANYKGYSDWRLPSLVELKSLIKADTTFPAIDKWVFHLTPPLGFWSASTYAPVPGYAWVVGFDYGGTYGDRETRSNYVRLVRSGQYFGSFGLFPVGVSGITATAATLTATSATGATGHWLVVPRNATPPTWAQIISGANYPTVTVAAHGSGAMAANTPATLALAGLAAGTSYDLYMVARESTDQTTSNISGPVPFSTLAIATSSIVIDPATPATLYAALDGAGVYKSSNSGSSWAPASTQPANLRVKALVIKPGTSGNSAMLFAASYGGGVFKSTDGGTNWATPANACATLPGTAGSQNVLTLVMAATAPAKLYAGSEAGVFVSEDDCASWTAMNAGMP